MHHLDPTLLQRYATALGDDVIDSLAERELIRSVDTLTFDPIEAGLLADRVAGTVAGLTLGDASVDQCGGQRRTCRFPNEFEHRSLDDERVQAPCAHPARSNRRDSPTHAPVVDT